MIKLDKDNDKSDKIRDEDLNPIGGIIVLIVFISIMITLLTWFAIFVSKDESRTKMDAMCTEKVLSEHTLTFKFKCDENKELSYSVYDFNSQSFKMMNEKIKIGKSYNVIVNGHGEIVDVKIDISD